MREYMDFVSKSLALSSEGLAGVANDLKLQVAEIWAVLSVETHGTGFLVDRRPPILFERHVFSRLTNHAFDGTSPDISTPSAGGYGASGQHQYDRLKAALALNEDAALKSTSWGLGQVMGYNFAAAGFNDVGSMIEAMVESEDGQIKAMCTFITREKLQPFLAAHDWTSFARHYNGPDFAKNQYDQRLRGAYAQFSVGAFPDLLVRSAQLYLTFQGLDPHGVDGVLGTVTGSCLTTFQRSHNLPETGLPDAATMKALTPQSAANGVSGTRRSQAINSAAQASQAAQP
jgi:hypothetical protein